MNWAIIVPQGDWVAEYPTTNGRIIQGIRLAAFYFAFVLALIVAMLGIAVFGDAERLAKVPWDTIYEYLQLLLWLIGILAAAGTAQYVGKRATAKPEVVKAESDAKIAEAQTGTFPVPTVLDKPAADAVAKALEARQREIASTTEEAVG